MNAGDDGNVHPKFEGSLVHSKSMQAALPKCSKCSCAPPGEVFSFLFAHLNNHLRGNVSNGSQHRTALQEDQDITPL